MRGKVSGRRALKLLSGQHAGRVTLRVDGGPSRMIMGSLWWRNSVNHEPKSSINDMAGWGVVGRQLVTIVSGQRGSEVKNNEIERRGSCPNIMSALGVGGGDQHPYSIRRNQDLRG